MPDAAEGSPRHRSHQSSTETRATSSAPANGTINSDNVINTDSVSAKEVVSAHYDTRLPTLPWSRRIQIPLIAAAVYSVIRLLGPTLRYEVMGWQHAERVYAYKKQII
jgi:hypothetical protein